MLYFVLILAMIALFALWRVEVDEREDAEFRAKCYRIERDNEIELRRKAENDAEALSMANDLLERQNEGLQDTCDALSHENANIYSERENLRKCTVEYAFSEWERREVEDIPGMVEYEREGIVLIYECGKIVGWRKADTVQVRFKRPKRKAKTPEQSTYEAPTAMMIVQVKHNKRLRIQAKKEKFMHEITHDILTVAIRENDRLRAEYKQLKADNGGNEEGS